MNPNIYVGRCEGSAIYLKWYYEAIIDHVETVSHLAPLIRIGWANTEGFVPYPGAGSNWGSNGVGDDLFSYGFDGVSLWTGELLRLEIAAAQSKRWVDGSYGSWVDALLPMANLHIYRKHVVQATFVDGDN